ncbi:MAG: hypothetical protein ACREM1_09250 [Longimicrobiales bacterium]
MIALPPWKRITDLEAALDDRGIPYRRWFDWNEGWFFEVNGQVVARGGAIGLLEQDVRRWQAPIAGEPI